MSRIDVYAICWNEEIMLPYFLRHYGRFASRIVVFDNDSTDSSREIAIRHDKVEVRRFGSSAETCGEIERMVVRDAAWQESRGKAEWVIVVDCDEFIWHPGLVKYLNACRERKVTIPRPTGFEMVAESFPTGTGQIYDHVRLGVPSPYMNKWLLFDPNAIETMNFAPGCHSASPAGAITFDDDPALKLLHFKHLGHDYVVSRYRQLERRRTLQDREMSFNHHYESSRHALADWLETALTQATDVVSGAIDPSL